MCAVSQTALKAVINAAGNTKTPINLIIFDNHSNPVIVSTPSGNRKIKLANKNVVYSSFLIFNKPTIVPNRANEAFTSHSCDITLPTISIPEITAIKIPAKKAISPILTISSFFAFPFAAIKKEVSKTI